ncbi:hypothetical protein ABFY09_09845 [Marinomonas sp. 5E14-1]|uniref:hypothetical protein n=1 Tax=Marinomonas sp. 5E14-1 TaxID=3153922 RepID=UPI003263270C
MKRTLERTPWWLVTAIIIGLVLLWNMATDQSYQRIAGALSQGLLTTIGVSWLFSSSNYSRMRPLLRGNISRRTSTRSLVLHRFCWRTGNGQPLQLDTANSN